MKSHFIGYASRNARVMLLDLERKFVRRECALRLLPVVVHTHLRRSSLKPNVTPSSAVARQIGRSGSGLQRAMKGMQHADCAIESLFFLEVVSAFLEQFSCPLGNSFSCCRDTIR
jgi:hypothetical protein